MSPDKKLKVKKIVNIKESELLIPISEETKEKIRISHLRLIPVESTPVKPVSVEIYKSALENSKKNPRKNRPRRK